MLMALEALGVAHLNLVEFEVVLNWTSVFMRASILLIYFSVVECSLLRSQSKLRGLPGLPSTPNILSLKICESAESYVQLLSHASWRKAGSNAGIPL